jgi:hypothetical protein
VEDHDRVAALAADLVLARLFGVDASQPSTAVRADEQHVHGLPWVIRGKAREAKLVDLPEAEAEIAVADARAEHADGDEDVQADE